MDGFSINFPFSGNFPTFILYHTIKDCSNYEQSYPFNIIISLSTIVPEQLPQVVLLQAVLGQQREQPQVVAHQILLL